MMKGLVFLVFSSFSLMAQPSLKIDKGVIFQLTGDSFSIDSLIMADSAVLLLDNRHSSNLLRANVVIVGNGCVISGISKNGENGPAGSEGSSSLYAAGKDGRGGFSGINLFFHFTTLQLGSILEIQLMGGHGGNGGLGGNITPSLSGISTLPSSRNYNTSTQGPPGGGGDGGRGGNVTLSYPAELDSLVHQKIKVMNEGGVGGYPAVWSGAPTRPLGSTPAAGTGKRGVRGKIKYVLLKK